MLLLLFSILAQWKNGFLSTFSTKKKLYIKVAVRFTFTHLADAFIQSDLQCIQAIHLYCQYVCCLGIKPTTFALLTRCSTTEPQEHSWTAEINTSGSKTKKMYFVFKTNYHYMDRLSILKKITVSYIILCCETPLPQCMICKLIHVNFCIILAIFVVYLV